MHAARQEAGAGARECDGEGIVLASAPDEYFGRRRMAKTLKVLQLLEDRPRALGKLVALMDSV